MFVVWMQISVCFVFGFHYIIQKIYKGDPSLNYFSYNNNLYSFSSPPPPTPSFHIFVLPSSLKDRKARSTQTVRSQTLTKAMKWAKPVRVWMEWTNEVKKFVLELWESQTLTKEMEETNQFVSEWNWAKRIKINWTTQQVWMQPNRSRFNPIGQGSHLVNKHVCVCVCVCVCMKVMT